MRGFIFRLIINAVALIVTAAIIKGMEFHGIFAPFVAAVVIGVLNAIVRPVLLVLTLPINILTLGLFTFVLNAFMLQITASVVSGFNVAGFWSAFVGAIFMTIISFVLSFFISDKGKIEYIVVKTEE